MTASVADIQGQTSRFDGDLEAARREFTELEREDAAPQGEYRHWVEAKAARFRPVLERFLALFPLIRELELTWRRLVYRGRVAADPETDRAVRSLYAFWLAYRGMAQDRAEYLTRHGVSFEAELDTLARHHREADRLLRKWYPPERTKAPSFRGGPLSLEGAERFRRILSGEKL